MYRKVLESVRACLAIGAFAFIGFITLGSSATSAATATDTFDVTATIVASCTISAGNLAFGNYDPLSATNTDGTSTVTVTCSNGAAYNVLLDGGISGNVAARTMDDDATGTQTLNYQLYSNAGRTTVWGETIGTDTVTGTGSGSAQNLTVYGRIPNGQTTPPIGAYTDTITATVDF